MSINIFRYFFLIVHCGALLFYATLKFSNSFLKHRLVFDQSPFKWKFEGRDFRNCDFKKGVISQRGFHCRPVCNSTSACKCVYSHFFIRLAPFEGTVSAVVTIGSTLLGWEKVFIDSPGGKLAPFVRGTKKKPWLTAALLFSKYNTLLYENKCAFSRVCPRFPPGRFSFEAVGLVLKLPPVVQVIVNT